MLTQNIIVFAIVIVCFALAGRHFYLSFTKKNKCNCGCADCKYSTRNKQCDCNKEEKE